MGRTVAVMECPLTQPEQQCAPLHAAACGAVVALFLSVLLYMLWSRLSSNPSTAMQPQPKAGPTVAPAAVPTAIPGRAVQLPLPLLQHDESLSVEVSSLLGRGRRSFIFKGGLSAHGLNLSHSSSPSCGQKASQQRQLCLSCMPQSALAAANHDR